MKKEINCPICKVGIYLEIEDDNFFESVGGKSAFECPKCRIIFSTDGEKTEFVRSKHSHPEPIRARTLHY